MKITWWVTAWDEYTSWTDRQMIRRINTLIADIVRNGHTGIGKPERLRGDLSGFWSRRINQEHRLVYRLVDDGQTVEILACKSHYDT